MRISNPTLMIAIKVGVVVAAVAVLISWLWYTPPGLLGKADAIGYAVCHRITVRSFFLADRPLPLCARCSGMYLGALVGYLFQFRLGRRLGMPTTKVTILLILFVAAFGLDGVNSYLHFFPNFPGLYEPQNWLRLITGTGLGIGIAAVMYPVFNQTIWIACDPRPSLGTWRQICLLLLLAAMGNLAMLSGNPFFLYPLGILESATVLFTLALIYTIVASMVTKRENTFKTWGELWPYLTAGFTIGLLQIGVMDFGRYLITGTWGGFVIGG